MPEPGPIDPLFQTPGREFLFTSCLRDVFLYQFLPGLPPAASSGDDPQPLGADPVTRLGSPLHEFGRLFPQGSSPIPQPPVSRLFTYLCARPVWSSTCSREKHVSSCCFRAPLNRTRSTLGLGRPSVSRLIRRAFGFFAWCLGCPGKSGARSSGQRDLISGWMSQLN